MALTVTSRPPYNDGRRANHTDKLDVRLHGQGV